MTESESAQQPEQVEQPAPPREQAAAEPNQSGPITAQQAGRGGLAISAAKVYFLFIGLVQQILLNHILGTQGYGAYSRVQSFASMVYNPVVSTAVQGVSRTVAGAEDDERPAATRRALGIHAVAIVPIATIFFLAAPQITRLLNAVHLTTAMRIVSGVLFFYGLYTPFVGVLNGNKRFTAQAGIDTLFATMRTVGLVGGAALFYHQGAGVEGALAGFVAAAGLILGVVAPLAGIGKHSAGGPSIREHLAFIAPLLGGQIALNLLLQCDLQLLGRFAADAAVAMGGEPELADTLTGAYRAAQLFCFLPYQLLLGVTFVLFPLLATAHRDGDREAVQRYVRTGTRLALIMMGLMVSVTGGLGGSLLRLVFRADTATLGAPVMLVLAPGLGAFAVFGILATVLTSLKRERLSALLTLAALGLVVALCFLLVRGQPYGTGMLVRTAIGTCCGLLLATLLTAVAVKRTAGSVAEPLTVIRVLVALAGGIAVGRLLPAPEQILASPIVAKILTVGYCALVGGAYLLMLAVSGELGSDDLATIRRVAGRAKT